MKHLFFILLPILSCKKDNQKLQQEFKSNIVSNEDSLRKIKDTTLFINSSEGEEVIFLINEKNNDSIINSEIFGESGKSQ